jgi:hypothetical protein
VVAPLAVIVGLVGNAFIDIVTPSERGEVHPKLVAVTVYVPASPTVIDWVLAPVDQTFPVADEEVKVTVLPGQMLVEPEGEIVGVFGIGFTVTFLTADVRELHVPLLTTTEYKAELFTVIERVVAPFDQR